MKTNLLIVFRQVIRSVTLLLLPIAFIALIVWATAGSSSGSTSDPIFTSIWFYLAAHQIPLEIAGSLAGARLSLLPLGALALVFLVIRSGIRRSLLLTHESEKRAVTISFALIYGAFVAVMAILASLQGGAISVHSYYAIPIALLISLTFSIIAAELMPARTRAPWEIATAWAAASFALLLAISTLVVIISKIIHFDVVLDLTAVISPGIFGGIAFFLLQLLYFPNLVVATLAYITGSGAHIGSDSMIHPLIFELDQLPAIPLLGLLPRGTFPWAISGALLVFALGIVIHRKLRSRFNDDRSSAIALGAFFLIATVLGLTSSGQLISDVLDQVGPSWWRFPLVLTGELALGMAISRGEIAIRAYLLTRNSIDENRENKQTRENNQNKENEVEKQ